MDKHAFAERLKRLRTDAGVTIAVASRDMGIAQGTLWRYENAEQAPRVEALIGLSDYYGVSVGYLLGTEEAA